MHELLSALELLFNTILTNGEYPSRWATGVIHPVYKKGDHGVPDNYRKITVMPCIGKLLESILINRLSFKNEMCNDNDPYCSRVCVWLTGVITTLANESTLWLDA